MAETVQQPFMGRHGLIVMAENAPPDLAEQPLGLRGGIVSYAFSVEEAAGPGGFEAQFAAGANAVLGAGNP